MDLQMNNNYPRGFTKHDILLHNLITQFCSEVVGTISFVSVDAKQISLSWCHLMATVVGDTLPVRVVDGSWRKRFMHSWVETPRGHVIDVSPVGCRSHPVMYPGKALVFHEGVYHELIADIRNSEKFQVAYASVMKQANEIRTKYQFTYLVLCKKYRIKPHAL